MKTVMKRTSPKRLKWSKMNDVLEKVGAVIEEAPHVSAFDAATFFYLLWFILSLFALVFMYRKTEQSRHTTELQRAARTRKSE